MRFALLVLPLLLLCAERAVGQDVICCNLLFGINGDYFGADRNCAEQFLLASQENRFHACRQIVDYHWRCADSDPYCYPCDGYEAKRASPNGNSLTPESPFYQGLVNGLKEYGIRGVGPEHITVQDLRNKKGGGIIRFQMRLSSEGCIMPSGDCVLAAGNAGKLPEGKQEGAKTMILGAIQFAGEKTRVNARYVNVETGEIKKSAKATKKGGRKKAIAKALAEVLDELKHDCSDANGLIF